MKSFDDILQLINNEINNINWSKKPAGLYEPIGYILALGGKRVRPAVTLMSYNLFGKDVMQAMKAAIGLEIFHNFTLLHDDIMDRADVRRGQTTVHKKWDDNTAILSGDVMQIEAYKWMLGTPEIYLKRVLEIFTKLASEICEGQQYDMEFESRTEISPEDYLEMIRLKTAVLIAGGCQIGALIGGADEDDAQNLYDFGNNIGLAFQLKDDLLDVYGDEASFGKRIGGDILCNKKTYLLINALKKAEGYDKEEFSYWLNINDPQRKSEKIEAVTTLYNRLGAKEICENTMNLYYDIAISHLDKVKVTEDRKYELRNLAKKLMSRAD